METTLTDLERLVLIHIFPFKMRKFKSLTFVYPASSSGDYPDLYLDI